MLGGEDEVGRAEKGVGSSGEDPDHVGRGRLGPASLAASLGPGGRRFLARVDHSQHLNHQRLCSGQIAFQPPHVRGTDEGFKTGFEVEHRLVRRDGVGQASLLHETVPEQAIIVGKVADRDQPPRQSFRFLEAVELVQNMSAQQHGVWRVGLLGGDDQSALLGQLVAPVVILCSGLSDEEPAELFDGSQPHLRWLVGPPYHALLVDDFLIQLCLARTRLGSEDKLQGRGTRDGSSG